MLLFKSLAIGLLQDILVPTCQQSNISNRVTVAYIAQLRYTPITQNIMTTCLIFCTLPFCRQNSSDASMHGLLKISEGDGADPWSHVSCEVAPPWIGLVCPARHPTDAPLGWGLGEFAGQVNTLNSSLCSSNCSWTIVVVWQSASSFLKDATAIREYPFHEGVY